MFGKEVNQWTYCMKCRARREMKGAKVMNFKGNVAIVGIGEVPTGKFPERPCLQNALEACKQAEIGRAHV